MVKGIVATLMLSLMVLAAAGATWSSTDFQQINEKHSIRKASVYTAAFRD